MYIPSVHTNEYCQKNNLLRDINHTIVRTTKWSTWCGHMQNVCIIHKALYICCCVCSDVTGIISCTSTAEMQTYIICILQNKCICEDTCSDAATWLQVSWGKKNAHHVLYEAFSWKCCHFLFCFSWQNSLLWNVTQWRQHSSLLAPQVLLMFGKVKAKWIFIPQYLDDKKEINEWLVWFVDMGHHLRRPSEICWLYKPKSHSTNKDSRISPA